MQRNIAKLKIDVHLLRDEPKTNWQLRWMFSNHDLIFLGGIPPTEFFEVNIYNYS